MCAALYLVFKRCSRKEAHTPLLSNLKFQLLKLKDQGPEAAAKGKNLAYHVTKPLLPLQEATSESRPSLKVENSGKAS